MTLMISAGYFESAKMNSSHPKAQQHFVYHCDNSSHTVQYSVVQSLISPRWLILQYDQLNVHYIPLMAANTKIHKTIDMREIFIKLFIEPAYII